MNVKHFIEDKILVFELTEEIDHHTCNRIKTRIDYEVQRFMPKNVIMDLKNVRFMDSAGIGLILGRYKTSQYCGGNLLITNGNSKIMNILKMAGIMDVIKICDDNILEKIS